MGPYTEEKEGLKKKSALKMLKIFKQNTKFEKRTNKNYKIIFYNFINEKYLPNIIRIIDIK